ncbi:hypothetical protein RGQ15_21470 [Paracoccus sp. MBLB3053]|uniref:Baseplate assembly protein n=1 Tax=Paracoccus aurantius TaxID=3073814 RepID=A0ABU2HYJ6_9RHOB|nr:hypothetical protein [Paracoccus sp. MBLB3053]MDS9470126.1 hypothetical protein [Paracoccus sp. MBLB3053]
MADSCCACEGIMVSTPEAAWNRPGLTNISVRAGTYTSFLDTMLARLSSSEHGALADLRTRDPAVDFSIAALDAWAVVGDILTFYAERLTVETLLPTARELNSLHGLAMLVGYAPSPGVAAEVEIAFRMSEVEGSPRSIKLPSGVKVQSTPGPDEAPVIFETTASIPARSAWNAMRPLLDAPQELTAGTTRLALAGTRTGLKSGDGVAFAADDGTPVFARVSSVTIEPANPALDPDAIDLTHLVIDPIATTPAHFAFAPPPDPMPPVVQPPLADHLGQTLSAGDLAKILDEAGVDDDAFFDPLIGLPEPRKRVLVFRQSTGIFGNAAPGFASLPTALTGEFPVYGPNDDGVIVIDHMEQGPYFGQQDHWADGTLEVLSDEAGNIYLDRVLKDVTAGSVVALKDGDDWGLYEVENVAELALARFAIQGRSTRLGLDGSTGFDQLTIRGTTVWTSSEWLDLPRRRFVDPLKAGDTQIALNGWSPGLQPGQRLALRGGYADGLDAPAVEAAEIQDVFHDLQAGGGTTITLATGLAYDHARDALRICGNVAPATHGETTVDLLGKGDPARVFPTFVARQGPLTHITAEVVGGAAPTTELRVGGILWKQVPNLLDARQGDRVYTLRVDETGIATYGFGDGVTGAMPASGQEIRATYRTGLGLAGRVRAGQLNILMTRPLGVEAAENPLPAEGGANPEPLNDLRRNLPLSCRTLGRVVSLSDYADYALTYAGIAKARAERVRIPGLGQPGIVLTVAGDLGAEILPGSAIYDGLVGGLRKDGIPYVRFRLLNYRPQTFRIGAKIKVFEEYLPDEVLAAAEAALRTAYGFEGRSFAQTVFASEILTTMQDVPGVEGVVLDLLYTGAVPASAAALLAAPASATQGAELLTLHSGPLDHLELMS